MQTSPITVSTFAPARQSRIGIGRDAKAIAILDTLTLLSHRLRDEADREARVTTLVGKKPS